MTMFHLQYPASKTFLTWDEMGCLCRSLGLPVDLFQRHFPTDVYELSHDDRGISVKTIMRLFELNLMQKALHRTYNMHTADWNVCVITRALYMLEHRVLDFEGLHDVRVAYGTYEHVDMKGLVIQKHVLLRTLKMCGRSIAPLKLMHRIKHMKGEFEEKGRIQLYEFFNLIVWCDLYTAYDPKDNEESFGKEEDLFKLVDFDRLLSHHDARLAARLDVQYLAEEWDFGMEALGSKEMFKEPPVYTEARITQALEEPPLNQDFVYDNHEQAKYHKQNYKVLKKEVTHSQKRLYRAYAGSIRSRPISAPDIDHYRHHKLQQQRVESSAHEAYETVRRRLNSAPSRASTIPSVLPPQIRVNEPERTPKLERVVTSSDLTDVKRKMEDLQFNINTLDSRCKLQVENEMDFYIPGYLDKLANRKPEEPPLPEPEKKERHWTSKIINNLAYPDSNLTPAHAKNCDARYRGWLKANSRPGYHAIITSHTHENSDKGRMFAKMEQSTLQPVQYTHQDYVIRYTPFNWPGVTASGSAAETKPARTAAEDSGSLSQKPALKPQHKEPPPIRFRSLENKGGEEEEEADEGKPAEQKEKKPIPDLSFFHNKYLSDTARTGESDSAAPTTAQDPKKPPKSTAASPEKEPNKQSYPRNLETSQQRKTLEPAEPKRGSEQQQQQMSSATDVTTGGGGKLVIRPADPARHDLHPDVAMKGFVDADWPTDVPIPHMEHSAPKLIGVGQIGTIALLENIDESRDLEDKFEEKPPIDDENVDEYPEMQDLKEDEDNEDPEDIEVELPSRPATQSDFRNTKGSNGRPSKSQPSSDQKLRKINGSLKVRPTHSAPQRRARGSSPRRTTPPKGNTAGNGGKSSKECKRVGSGDDRLRKAPSDDAQQKSEGQACQRSRVASSQTVTSGSGTSSSPVVVPKGFKVMRGSVTSEEEGDTDESGGKGKNNKHGGVVAKDTKSLLHLEFSEEQDDQSVYSDALTIASSDGLSDLPASPPAGTKRVPINLALGSNPGSTTSSPQTTANALLRTINAPRIQFDLVNIRTGLGPKSDQESITESDLTSETGEHHHRNQRVPVRHSSATERQNSLMVQCHLREYLSDSEARKPNFPRESRARLVGRVENVISPDLRHKLMGGDPGLTIQAS